MIEIIEQPNLFAFANTPILYKVKSDNLSTHYNTKYQYRYLLNNTGWSGDATFTLKLYFNDNGKPLELFFRAGLLDGFRIGYTITAFDSILMSSSQLCQDLLKNNTLNAYVEVERVIVGSRYYIVFTPKTDDIIKIEFETNFQYETKMEVLPITNIRNNYKIVAELISQRYEENIQSRYDTIHSSVGYLNAANEAIFDFSSSVSNVLSNNTFDNFFQSIISDNTAVSWRGELKFGVHVYETWIDGDGNDVVGDHIMSSYSSMLQNGLQGIDKLLGINFFDSNDGYNLLSYQPRLKIVSKEDIDYLPFFLKERNSTVVVKVSLNYKSDPSVDTLISAPNSRLSCVFIVPSGYHQLRIDDYADPLKLLVSYIVELQTVGGVSLSESVEYLIDYKYYETNNSFIYLNSLGVPEAINLKGVKTTTSEVERKILRMPKIDGQLSQFAHLVTPSYKLASGNQFSKVMFKSIDELIASNQTYEVLNGVIAPIIISNKGTTEYTEKNNILEFVLEYAPAIKGGVMLSAFYKRLSVKRSVCRPTFLISSGGSTGMTNIEVGNSYDSKNHILDDNADVEYIFTLLRPNPVTIRIAGEFRQPFAGEELAKLAQVGLNFYFGYGPTYYYDLIDLVKNSLRNPALAFPIQVSCRVRQKSIGDEWSLPKVINIPVLELTSMYKPIQDMVKWKNYIFGVHIGCVFMVDERGRRTTIAGSLTDYGSTTGLGTDARFDALYSIVVDEKQMQYDFPTIYIYDYTANRLCSIYLFASPQIRWYVAPVFTFADTAYRKLTIHPTLRYSGNKPVFLISELYNTIPAKSLICTINMDTLTRIHLINLSSSANIADGNFTQSKCHKIMSLQMTSEKELVFLENGYTNKTPIFRVALANITAFTVADKIWQLNNPISWTVKTIAGAGSTVNTYADINSVATAGASIVLGTNASSMRLFANVHKIIKHGDDYYIAAGISNVVLKLTKQEGVISYEPYYYKVEIVTGKSDEAGFFYDIPSMTLLNQPLSITSDDNYLYISQNLNGQIIKISLKDGTASVFSGEGTYVRARDWGVQ